jgi:hypothetical protein
MTCPPLPLRPVRVSVLLAAVFVALAWAGTATAGCGDHVIVLKPAGAKQTTDDAPPPKAPCHGPNCQAEPPANPLPAPISSRVLLTPAAKELFTPIDWSPADPRTAVGRPFESSSPRPIHRASSIFHPPRS